MQYLAWAREAADGLLIGNPYRLDETPAAFLHPGFALSGLLVRAGVSPALALLLWKPAAVLALFFAVRAFLRQALPDVWPRRAALVLAFFCVPIAAWIGHFDAVDLHGAEITVNALAFDIWPGSWLWGYPFTALAVAALAGGLVSYARDREAGRAGLLAPALALLCSWLQPWQGATFVIVVIAMEILSWQDRSPARLRALVSVTVAGALPLVYYAALSRWDPSWETARTANLLDVGDWWPIFLVAAPLLVPALIAYGIKPASPVALMSRLWLPAAIGLYFLIERGRIGTFPLHAVQGMSVPLAVLAVEGTASLLGRGVGRPVSIALALAVAALLVPPLAWRLKEGYDKVENPVVSFFAVPEPMFLEPGERDALRALPRLSRHGVLTRRYLGQVVPGYAGVSTWVGTASWTPDFENRVRVTEALFGGHMAPADARALVRSSGADVLLSDCGAHAALRPLLGSLVRRVHRYGCATAYEISRTRG